MITTTPALLAVAGAQMDTQPISEVKTLLGIPQTATHISSLRDDTAGSQQDFKSLINACTQGTDQSHLTDFRCPACTGCKACKTGQRYGYESPAAMLEQHHVKELLTFEKHDMAHPDVGHYQSELPLVEDWQSHIASSNFDEADAANKKLCHSLKDKHNSKEAIKQSFQDFITRDFIIERDQMPADIKNNILSSPVQYFIPQSIAYKDTSHSTKVRVCWDSTRTRKGSSLNSLLMTGSTSYSMTRLIILWRRGKFALSTDIRKFYNNVHLHPKHYNLHQAVWRPDMNADSPAVVFILLRHFYGVSSTAAVLKAVMEDAGDNAENIGLPDVAAMIRAGFVDDLSFSGDKLEDIKKLKSDLKQYMDNKGLPLKGFAITHQKPEESLSTDEWILVGGNYWTPLTDQHSLKTPTIFIGKNRKGKFEEGTRFLINHETEEEVAEFYKGEPITLKHIFSRTQMLYDQGGGCAPLAGFGRWVTRQALLDTKGVFQAEVAPATKALFFNYIHQVSMYGRLKFKRNFGLARDPRQAHILAYYDAGSGGELYVIYIIYETTTKGVWHCEFVYSSHALTPQGRNIPHAELNSGYRASRMVAIVEDWLAGFIISKSIIGDSRIVKFWILNRHKRLTTFVRNRVFNITRIFSTNDVYWCRTMDNPADLGTKFTDEFYDTYKLLADGLTFRAGPDYLRSGVQEAVTNHKLIPITELKLELSEQQDAATQLLDSHQVHTISSDGPTAHETVCLFAMETQLPAITDTEDPRARDESVVMLCTDQAEHTETEQESRIAPDIQSKVALRLAHSNYLVCPLRLPYNRFLNTTTVLLAGIRNWVTRTTSRMATEGKATKNMEALIARLTPSTSDHSEIDFLLGRADRFGSIEQRHAHSVVSTLESQAATMVKQIPSPASPAMASVQAAWKQYQSDKEDRLNNLTTVQWPGTQDWFSSIHRTTTALQNIISKIQSSPPSTEQTGLPTEASEVLFCQLAELKTNSYQPLDDIRLHEWLTYPGIPKLVSTFNEVRDLISHLDGTQKHADTDLGRVLAANASLLQDIIDLTIKLQKTALRMKDNQFGPVAISGVAKLTYLVLDRLPDSSANSITNNHNWKKLLKYKGFIGTKFSKWPIRKIHNLQEIFQSANDFKEMSKLTNIYVAQKASSECIRFIDKASLNKHGIFRNNIWHGRHRLYAVQELHLLLHDKPGIVPKDLGLTAKPFLLDAFSPLAWSIGLYVHYSSSAADLSSRPSAIRHRGWKTCEKASLEYGLIMRSQMIFRRIEQSCITCSRRKMKTAKQPQGPLHHSVLDVSTPFKFVMMDLAGKRTVKNTTGAQVEIYTLLAVCCSTRLTKSVQMQARSSSDFLLALNVLFGEFGLPAGLWIDREGGLLRIYRKMLIEVNQQLLLAQKPTVQMVTAHAHWPAGLIERRVRVLNESLGCLSHVADTNMSETNLGNFVRIIVARMNATPYSLRFTDSNPTHLQPEQDVLIDMITPNHWSFIPGQRGGAFISIKTDLNEHEKAMQSYMDVLRNFHHQYMIPRLLTHNDPSKATKPHKLSIGQLVVFWPDGPDNTRPKYKPPKIGKISGIHKDDAGIDRKVDISYMNHTQMKLDGRTLCGKAITTTRQAEHIAPLLDPSKEDIWVSLEAARKTAEDIQDKPGMAEGEVEDVCSSEAPITEVIVDNEKDFPKRRLRTPPPGKVAQTTAFPNQLLKNREDPDFICKAKLDPSYTGPTTRSMKKDGRCIGMMASEATELLGASSSKNKNKLGEQPILIAVPGTTEDLPQPGEVIVPLLTTPQGIDNESDADCPASDPVLLSINSSSPPNNSLRWQSIPDGRDNTNPTDLRSLHCPEFDLNAPSPSSPPQAGPAAACVTSPTPPPLPQPLDRSSGPMTGLARPDRAGQCLARGAHNQGLDKSKSYPNLSYNAVLMTMFFFFLALVPRAFAAPTTGLHNEGDFTGSFPVYKCAGRAQKMSVGRYSLEAPLNCHNSSSRYKPPRQVRVQMVQQLSSIPITMTQCLIRVSYHQSWCGTNGFTNQAHASRVVKKTVVSPNTLSCQHAGDSGNITFTIPVLGTSQPAQVQTKLTQGAASGEVFLIGWNNQHSDCRGGKFKHGSYATSRSILRAEYEVTVQRRTAKLSQDHKKLSITDLLVFNRHDDARRGNSVDETISHPSDYQERIHQEMRDSLEYWADPRFGLFVAEKAQIPNDACQAARTIWVSDSADIHQTRDNLDGMDDIIEVKGSHTQSEEVALQLGAVENLCGRQMRRTAVPHLFLLELKKHDDPLPLKAIGGKELDRWLDLKSMLLSSVASSELALESDFVQLQYKICQNTRQLISERNRNLDSKAQLIFIDDIPKLTVKAGELAYTFACSEASATVRRLNRCCEELPIATGGQDLFMKAITRRVTKHCTPRECSTTTPNGYNLGSPEVPHWICVGEKGVIMACQTPVRFHVNEIARNSSLLGGQHGIYTDQQAKEADTVAERGDALSEVAAHITSMIHSATYLTGWPAAPLDEILTTKFQAASSPFPWSLAAFLPKWLRYAASIFMIILIVKLLIVPALEIYTKCTGDDSCLTKMYAALCGPAFLHTRYKHLQKLFGDRLKQDDDLSMSQTANSDRVALIEQQLVALQQSMTSMARGDNEKTKRIARLEETLAKIDTQPVQAAVKITRSGRSSVRSDN